jgi:hypothetical protein
MSNTSSAGTTILLSIRLDIYWKAGLQNGLTRPAVYSTLHCRRTDQHLAIIFRLAECVDHIGFEHASLLTGKINRFGLIWQGRIITLSICQLTSFFC